MLTINCDTLIYECYAVVNACMRNKSKTFIVKVLRMIVRCEKNIIIDDGLLVRMRISIENTQRLYMTGVF